MLCVLCSLERADAKPRARELGIPFDGTPGPLNAITDVAAVAVGYTTLIDGAGEHAVRTGVTAILPRGRATLDKPVFAGVFSLNGNGEMTGTHWIEESGFLEGPVMITGTHSVGTVRDAVIAWRIKQGKPDRERLLVVAARRRGDVGRRSERRERLSRESRARVRCDRRRARRRARRRQRRRRHGDDLPRVQVRHRHELARRGDRGSALHGRRAGAGELRCAQRAADRRCACRQVHAGEAARVAGPGIDHHRRRDRCAAPAAATEAAGAARVARARAQRQLLRATDRATCSWRSRRRTPRRTRSRASSCARSPTASSIRCSSPPCRAWRRASSTRWSLPKP